jgi:hypothetical protein
MRKRKFSNFCPWWYKGIGKGERSVIENFGSGLTDFNE